MIVYAHNAAFDLNFIVKGINYGLLASVDTKFPETSALGPDESRIKKLIVGPCSYQDTFQVFGMSLSSSNLQHFIFLVLFFTINIIFSIEGNRYILK